MAPFYLSSCALSYVHVRARVHLHLKAECRDDRTFLMPLVPISGNKHEREVNHGVAAVRVWWEIHRRRQNVKTVKSNVKTVKSKAMRQPIASAICKRQPAAFKFWPCYPPSTRPLTANKTTPKLTVAVPKKCLRHSMVVCSSTWKPAKQRKTSHNSVLDYTPPGKVRKVTTKTSPSSFGTPQVTKASQTKRRRVCAHTNKRGPFSPHNGNKKKGTETLECHNRYSTACGAFRWSSSAFVPLAC